MSSGDNARWPARTWTNAPTRLEADGSGKYLYTPDAIRVRARDGWSKTRPTLEQGTQILKIIDEGLRKGAIGVGSTLGYMRAGVSSREIYETVQCAASPTMKPLRATSTA